MVKRKKKIGIKEDMTMKKNILSMAVLLMASAAVFTACSSDDNITGEQPANSVQKTYTMTVNATKGDDATTRALTLGRNDADTKNVLNATWDANEEVLVYQGGSKIGTLHSAASATNETTLTGTLDSAPDAGQDLTLYFHTDATPSYTGQDGTLATIASTYDFCAPATITAGNFTVSGSTVSTTGSASFGANQQAIVKFTLIDKADGTTPLSASPLVINDGTTDYTITPASATSVIYAAIPGFTGKTVTLTATVGGDTYTYEKASVSFTNGKYYEISVKMTKQASTPTGAISGKFTINGSGKQVYFSKGNLQATYDGTDWTWAFAANQWDYIGANEGNTKVSATSPFVSDYSGSSTTVDLFGWVGASSTWTGVAQYGITSSTATNNTDGYGNNAGEALKSDWGTLMGSGWRTLTSTEWKRVFNNRTASTVNGTADARYAKATVAGKTGIILFPDTYTHPSDVIAPASINTANAAFTVNSYDATAWGKMETAGAVFLPAAGYRFLSPSYAGTIGRYWSSTPYSSFAYNVSFDESNLTPDIYSSRENGYSVRLVREVE
jgi:hypothetical protein